MNNSERKRLIQKLVSDFSLDSGNDSNDGVGGGRS